MYSHDSFNLRVSSKWPFNSNSGTFCVVIINCNLPFEGFTRTPIKTITLAKLIVCIFISEIIGLPKNVRFFLSLACNAFPMHFFFSCCHFFSFLNCQYWFIWLICCSCCCYCWCCRCYISAPDYSKSDQFIAWSCLFNRCT